MDSSAAARLEAAARVRAARLRVQRAKAARAARAHARRRVQSVGRLPAALERSPVGSDSRGGVLPFALALIGAALLLFGLAAMPARLVPWSWVVYALDDRREKLAYSGIAVLIASAALLFAG